MPRAASWCCRPWCQTLSNAFWKSRKIAATFLPRSCALYHFSVRYNNCIVVDSPGTKPNWWGDIGCWFTRCFNGRWLWILSRVLPRAGNSDIGPAVVRWILWLTSVLEERDHSCLFPHSREDAGCDREVEDVGHSGVRNGAHSFRTRFVSRGCAVVLWCASAQKSGAQQGSHWSRRPVTAVSQENWTWPKKCKPKAE